MKKEIRNSFSKQRDLPRTKILFFEASSDNFIIQCKKKNNEVSHKK